MELDVVINGGRFFDGQGSPAEVRHLGIAGGKLVTISKEPLSGGAHTRVIDADGAWVMPGFVDCHTHYDAELIASPGLTESVRHGVTTVVIGSCSISTILSSAEDCSDLFTRVESIPREHVLPLFQKTKTWDSPEGYVDFLEQHPIGPNVATFLGHSDLRTRVMGLGRAVDPKEQPTEGEVGEMVEILERALDAGMLGLSSMTNPWDKLDGDRYRSRALPSTYARWKEYRRLHRVLRRRGRVLQSAPNITTKANVLGFFAESIGLLRKQPLKTTLITMADAKSSRGLHRAIGAATGFLNRYLGADFRWQTIPMPFQVYADGIDLVVFEEFGAGEKVLHLVDTLDRNALMNDEAYRREFRRDYESRFSPKVWQRDFGDAFIVACPDASVVGKSFADVARERGCHAVDTFLDLVVAHGTELRWRTTIANDRPKELERMASDPSVLIGFADSGAHIRNMAFYSFPLHLLRMAQKAEQEGRAFMSVERAVHRLTGEIADWLGVDAGALHVGCPADVVIVRPEALDERLDVYHEAKMDAFGGISRMVNRSDGAVDAVIIGGQIAFQSGVFADGLGKQTGYGRYLRADGKGSSRSRTKPASSRSSLPAAATV